MFAQEPPDTAPVTDAAAPFDDPKADVILRSADNVDFCCYKVLLALASTFFDGMFALPQPQPNSNGLGTGDGDAMKNGLDVVLVAESAGALAPTLRLCHPSFIRNPPVSGTDVFHFRRYHRLCRSAARDVAHNAVGLREGREVHVVRLHGQRRQVPERDRGGRAAGRVVVDRLVPGAVPGVPRDAADGANGAGGGGRADLPALQERALR